VAKSRAVRAAIAALDQFQHLGWGVYGLGLFAFGRLRQSNDDDGLAPLRSKNCDDERR
jgi:hypothetical protein